MSARYKKGQRVTIVPSKVTHPSPLDAAIRPYAGQSGRIIDCYWMNLSTAMVYIYTVRIIGSKREIVVHEDEIESHID